MWNLFGGIKDKIDLHDKLRLVCKSLDFSKSYNHMPDLQFEYTLKDNLLTITGPFRSFYGIEPYVLTYLTTTGLITFNGDVMDSSSFSKLHKTIREVHQNLLARESYLKDIQKSLGKISDARGGRVSSGGSSDYDGSRSGHSERKRNYDVNTDIVYGSSDSCSSSSSSRDRDRCDD
jgi:hypothetical protein